MVISLKTSRTADIFDTVDFTNVNVFRIGIKGIKHTESYIQGCNLANFSIVLVGIMIFVYAKDNN